MSKNTVSTSYRDVGFIWRQFGSRRILQIIMVATLMIASVAAEMLSIGAIVPFVRIIIEGDGSSLDVDLNIFWIDSFSVQANVFIAVFVLLIVCSAALRLFVLWASTKLSVSLGIQLRKRLYTTAVNWPYEKHLLQNSSSVISIVNEKAIYTIRCAILQVLVLTNSLILSFAIVAVLFLIDPFISVISLAVLGASYILIAVIARAILRKNGKILAENMPINIKYVQEGLGGIRDLIMSGNKEFYVGKFLNSAILTQKATAQNVFLTGVPRPLIEVIAIILITAIALYLKSSSVDGGVLLATIATLAFGTQRLIPALQQAFSSWSEIQGSLHTVGEVVSFLSTAGEIDVDIKSSPVFFEKRLVARNVAFKYALSPELVLNNISFQINKGERIGITGKTGSGKTTLVDLIMGLLSPSEGLFEVDDLEITPTVSAQWAKLITHVPQSIFLSEASIAENIAFGVESKDIDLERVIKAAKAAQIYSFIESLPHRFESTVGERGMRLSGGQQQRIGIARAIYRMAPVIILDEATSALDEKTEDAVMTAIGQFDSNVTVIMIAHRLSTLTHCDRIFDVSEAGKLIVRNVVKK